jgi:hypothetical protein
LLQTDNASPLVQPEDAVIKPGAAWFDTAGKRIYAGGGGIYVDDTTSPSTYWWIGEGEKVRGRLCACRGRAVVHTGDVRSLPFLAVVKYGP